jgi:serine/threonine protein kinase
LIALKTARHGDNAELIGWESTFSNRLNHPLIVDLRDFDFADVAFASEFAGNGSLACHLTAKRGLGSANRITMIITGIALGMAFVHFRDVIHCHLKPDDVSLDWDWNVRIANWSSSVSSREEKPRK